jgi:hypothetical protein
MSVVIIAAAMFAMPFMHEDMHERTEQENQKWQIPHEMGPMLSPEKKPCNCQKNNQCCLGS